MPKLSPDQSEPTDNLISLAHDGFKYARLLKNGREYVGLPSKAHSTHKIVCHVITPRVLTKDVPTGTIRMCYDDAKNFKEFPNTEEGRELAKQQMDWWKELAKNAAPTSAVAVPRGRSYKHFVAERAKAAADGSLYSKNKKQNAMNKNKPTPPKKGANKNRDQKNGMTRPKDGTATGKVWDIADKLGADRAAVIKEATKRGLNIATITTQYGKWRVYNGLKGRTAKVAKKKPSPPKKKPAPPAAAAV